MQIIMPFFTNLAEDQERAASTAREEDETMWWSFQEKSGRMPAAARVSGQCNGQEAFRFENTETTHNMRYRSSLETLTTPTLHVPSRRLPGSIWLVVVPAYDARPYTTSVRIVKRDAAPNTSPA